jgi:hypothetical protein
MRTANQVPEAADNLEIWLKEAGFGNIKSETGSVDLGSKYQTCYYHSCKNDLVINNWSIRGRIVY